MSSPMGPPLIKTYGFESKIELILNVGIVLKSFHLQKQPSCVINMSNFFSIIFSWDKWCVVYGYQKPF